MRFLNRLSIRDRFLLSPLIGIFITLILYFTATATIESKVELLSQISKNNLPLVSEYSKASIAMLNVHAKLTHLLLETMHEPDEELMYLGGREIINQLYVIEEHLFENLAKSEMILLDKLDLIAQNKLAFIHYKKIVISAIELVSVDPSLSRAELLRTNILLGESYTLLVVLSDYYIETISIQAERIDDSIDSGNIVTVMTISMLIIMIVISLFFAGRMSASIEMMGSIMVRLAKGDIGLILPKNEDQYLSKTYAAVATFKETLLKNKHQQQDLEKVVKALEVSKERYFNLLDIAASAIIVVDEKLSISLFNKAAQQLFGFDFTEIDSEDFLSLIENNEQMTRQTLTDFIANDKSQVLSLDKNPIAAHKKNGDIFYISAVLAKQHDAAHKLVTISIVDISERLLREQSLKDNQDQLEILVADRTKELQASLNVLRNTQNRLVESEKMAALGGLVAGVAHEINTPVGIGITASSQLQDLTQDFADKFDSGQLSKNDLDKFIEQVGYSTKINLLNLTRAAGLINSFKEMSVDQSTEEIRQFNIHQYSEDILLSVKPKFKNTAHQIILHCPKDIVINNVPGVYSQILTNLLMNSLVHGFEAVTTGEIIIKISICNESIRLEYSDNGGGMDAEQLKKIYEPFYTSKRSQGSTGLGMNIVYNLVSQTLGGSIQCQSKKGEGVIFNIQFPCNLVQSN